MYESHPEEVMADTSEKPVVLITGCSGLIGSRLIERLQGEFHVVGLDIQPPRDNTGCTFFTCDLTEDDSVQSVIAQVRDEFGSRIASVVHLAAYYDFAGKPSPLYRTLTVEGTGRLMRTLQGMKVEQFIFSSTLLVMQSSESGQPITAASPVEAEWDYPQSKLETEKLLEREHGMIPTVVLRMAGVYDAMCHSVPIAQQISRIHQKQLESYLFPGDKTHGQSFIHLEDLMDCLHATISRRHQLGPWEVLVIGEEDVMSYEELQDQIGLLLHGEEWTTIWVPKFAAKAGAWVIDKFSSEDQAFIKPWMIDLADQHYPVDLQEARQKLGWSPKHTLRATLPAMIQNLKVDPRHWYQENGLPLPKELQPQEQPSRR